jgi:hypothetical protein
MALPSTYPDRLSNLRFSMVIVTGAALLAVAGGCTSSSGEPPCLPPAYSVKPTSAKPGETVTVTAPAAECNPRYGTNALIQVVVTDAAGVQIINRTTQMTDAGEFTYTFNVPDRMAVGDAAVTAMPHNIDWCDDTGRNNRAGGETVTLEQASCAVPVELLSITR